MDTRYGPRPDLDAQRTEEAFRILREKFKEVSMDELEPRVIGCENILTDILNRLARIEAKLTEIEQGEYLAPPIPKGKIVEIAGPPAKAMSDLHARLCEALGMRYNYSEEASIDAVKLLQRRIDDMIASRDLVSKERDKLLAENKKLNERIDGIGAILASAYDEDNFAQGGS